MCNTKSPESAHNRMIEFPFSHPPNVSVTSSPAITIEHTPDDGPRTKAPHGRRIQMNSRATRATGIGVVAAAVTITGLALPTAVQADTTAPTTQSANCAADEICAAPSIAQNNGNVTLTWTPPADKSVVNGYEAIVEYHDYNGKKLGRYSVPTSANQTSKTIMPAQESWNPWTDKTNSRPALVSAMVVTFVQPSGKVTMSPWASTLANAPDGSLAPGIQDNVASNLSLQQVLEGRPTTLTNENQLTIKLKAARGAKAMPVNVWFTPKESIARQLIASPELQESSYNDRHTPGSENYGQAWASYWGRISYAPPATDGTITVTYAGSRLEYDSDNRQGDFAYPKRLVTDTAAAASYSVVRTKLSIRDKKTYNTKTKTQKVRYRLENSGGPTKVALQQFKNGHWVTVVNRDVTDPPEYVGMSGPKYGTYRKWPDPTYSIYSTFTIKAPKTKTKYRTVQVNAQSDARMQQANATSPVFTIKRVR